MAGNGGTANYESHNRVSNNCQAAGTSVAGWVAHNPVSVSTDNGATEESAPLFESDEFRMYCYKVLPCAKRTAHEWTSCPWAHPGEKARRRDPRVHKYLAIPCPNTKEGKTCPRGDECPNCHSLFEYWLHPSRYRTQLCRNNDGSCCKRQICFFAHSVDELRVPDHSHLRIPEEMLQQSSSKAATSAAPAASSTSAAPGSQSPKSPIAGSPKQGKHNKPASLVGRQQSLPSAASTDIGASAVRCGSQELSAVNLGPLPEPMMGLGIAGGISINSNGLVGASGFPIQSSYVDGTTGMGGLQQPSNFVQPQAMVGNITTSAVPNRRPSLDMVAPINSAVVPDMKVFVPNMMTDPEVPCPVAAGSTPATAAFKLWQQQQSMQTQQQHFMDTVGMGSIMGMNQDQLMGPTLLGDQQQLSGAAGTGMSYEQQLHYLMSQQQQKQPGWKGRRCFGSYAEYASSQQQKQSALKGRRCFGSYADYASSVQQQQQLQQAQQLICDNKQGMVAFTDFTSSSGRSPPTSPTPSSMLGSGSSSAAPDDGSLFSSLGTSVASGSTLAAVATAMGAAGRPGWQSDGLLRTGSGPATFGLQPAGHVPAFRFNSADLMTVVEGAGVGGCMPGADEATVAAAQTAAVQLQLEALQQQCNVQPAVIGGMVPQTSMGMGQLAGPMPSLPQASPGHSAGALHPITAPLVGPQDGTNDNLDLVDVAQLVDSVNRGELGESGNQVLTGVISLLMQQLQRQQLAA